MDNTTPKPDQNTKAPPVQANDPAGQSVTPVSAPQGGKEYEPGQSLHEYAQLPGHEIDPNLSPELEKAGVEKTQNPEHPQLTIEDKRAGLSHGVDAVTHPLQPGATLLPATKEEAIAVVENKQIKIWESFKWRMKNIIRQYAKGEMNR